jgi:mRNA-degrading endonuclease RelE of RelBE toxin-antitoxin system
MRASLECDTAVTNDILSFRLILSELSQNDRGVEVGWIAKDKRKSRQSSWLGRIRKSDFRILGKVESRLAQL